MKKVVAFGLGFVVVWGLASGLCYLLGLIFDWAVFKDWVNVIFYGFASALGGLLGPKITRKR